MSAASDGSATARPRSSSTRRSSGPIPWSAPDCARAGTVHLGGTIEEIAASEAAVGRGGHPDRPFVLLAQPSLFDPTRAPAGQHTAWAYCHVPNGSTLDMTDRIEAQVERFAPGFRDVILARHVMAPADFETYNANYIGGDINGGARTSASYSRARWRASSPTRPPCPASISARPRRRRAAEFTGCADIMQPGSPFDTRSENELQWLIRGSETGKSNRAATRSRPHGRIEAAARLADDGIQDGGGQRRGRRRPHAAPNCLSLRRLPGV